MKHKKNRYSEKHKKPIFSELHNLIYTIWHSTLIRIFLIFILVVTSIGFIVSFIEANHNNAMYTNFFDGIWWSLVTITTVGYGDKFPQSVAGRIFAMLLMLSGIALTTLISGTIASIFVERRIREGKGLQMIKTKDHIVVCGYNKNILSVLEGFTHTLEKPTIVLVNSMDSNEFESLQASVPGAVLKFVKGDFTQDKLLNMASIKTARSCIIIPDYNKETGFSNADEKTILACLTIRSLAPDIRITACIVKPESKSHLIRSHIDDIILQDEFISFLITASGCNSGVSEAVTAMLDYKSAQALHKISFPSDLIGKTFQEAVQWFLVNKKAVLVGVLSQEKSVTLDDLLSDDSSAIDRFIKRKFEEANISVDDETTQANIKLAPDPSYIITQNDAAFIIGGTA